MNIQWFPGHMQKTRKMIEENLKMVDLVVEIVDARIPLASQNPLLNTLLGQKRKLLVLNKADIADPGVTRAWSEAFSKQGIPVLAVNAKEGFDSKPFYALVRQCLEELLRRREEKGVKKPIRMMVVGIPNVGKSSFINRLKGKAPLKAEDRPGVTRDKQWVVLSPEFELLDTPGILWPKFEDEAVSLKLAFTGAVKDETMDIEELAYFLVQRLQADYADLLHQRYQVPVSPNDDTMELIESIARRRGAVMSGGRADLPRVSRLLLDEFRAGKLGRISLERPEA